MGCVSSASYNEEQQAKIDKLKSQVIWSAPTIDSILNVIKTAITYGNYDDALQFGLIALKQKQLESNPKLLEEIAKLFERHDQIEEANKYFQLAKKAKEEIFLKHFTEGTSKFNQDKYSEAKPHFLQCIEVKPDHKYCHYYLGICFLYTQQPENAVQFLLIAQEEESLRETENFHIKLGISYFALNRTYAQSIEGENNFSKAVFHIRKAIEIGKLKETNLNNCIFKRIESLVEDYENEIAHGAKFESDFQAALKAAWLYVRLHAKHQNSKLIEKANKYARIADKIAFSDQKYKVSPVIALINLYQKNSQQAKARIQQTQFKNDYEGFLKKYLFLEDLEVFSNQSDQLYTPTQNNLIGDFLLKLDIERHHVNAINYLRNGNEKDFEQQADLALALFYQAFLTNNQALQQTQTDLVYSETIPNEDIGLNAIKNNNFNNEALLNKAILLRNEAIQIANNSEHIYLLQYSNLNIQYNFET